MYSVMFLCPQTGTLSHDPLGPAVGCLGAPLSQAVMHHGIGKGLKEVGLRLKGCLVAQNF